MKIGEFDEYLVRNMREDALEAIDALESIVNECESKYVSRRYMQEKAKKAEWCINYIVGVVGGEE